MVTRSWVRPGSAVVLGAECEFNTDVRVSPIMIQSDTSNTD